MLTRKMFSIKPFDIENNYGRWRFSYEVGDYYTEEPVTENVIKINIAGKWAIQIKLPPFLKAIEKKIYPSKPWSPEEVKRIGRDYYINYYARSYGIIFDKDYVVFNYGPYSMNDEIGKDCRKLFNYGWKEYTFVQTEYFDLDGNIFHCAKDGDDWKETCSIREKVPSVSFLIEDYDGARIVATTKLERRTWTRGRGFFSWLKWFCKDLVITSIDISYSGEVGTEKGSWKGGTIGCSHDISDLPIGPGIHELAFKQHCEKEHTAKGNKYKIKFISALKNEQEHASV